MVVFLVPVGADRYQLYVEIPVEETQEDAAPVGRLSKPIQKFRAMLAEAEQERLRRESGDESGGTGLWRFVLRKIAETIAEQRLLWHLRHQTAAEVQHPDCMSSKAALHEVRAEFGRDVARHRRWMIIDALIAAITGPLFFLVPGPNILAWYFTFRAIGHLFAWRGARKGLGDVNWTTSPSPVLTEVLAAVELPSQERRRRLLDIGDRLGLQHLAGFVERVRRKKPA
jgi:hypothetical protein